MSGRTISIAFGLAGAGVVALVGPVYGGLVLILAVPVVFLTLSRAITGATLQPDFAFLLASFGLAWLLVLPFAPITRNSGEPAPPDVWILEVGVGVAPLLMAVLLFARRRLVRTT